MIIAPYLVGLGVTERHVENCALPLESEPEQLIDAGFDVFDRPLRMTPATFAAWQKMQCAAEQDNIELLVVSGFRSVEYQCQLIQKKLDAGQQIEDILKVNAIPGYSEHHSGRALDLTTPGFAHLETEFETSPAFHWLQQRANDFDFYLSYPKDNSAGIDYEPWHWALRTS